jgi:hypothetical protein
MLHLVVSILVAARSKAWVFERWLVGNAGLNPAGAWVSVSCECCKVDVSATGRSLVQGSPTWCSVSLRDL